MIKAHSFQVRSFNRQIFLCNMNAALTWYSGLKFSLYHPHCTVLAVFWLLLPYKERTSSCPDLTCSVVQVTLQTLPGNNHLSCYSSAGLLAEELHFFFTTHLTNLDICWRSRCNKSFAICGYVFDKELLYYWLFVYGKSYKNEPYFVLSPCVCCR